MSDSNSKSRLINPLTKAPLPQTSQPGYYPGYSTLSQKKFWDAATRTVVEKRVNEIPPLRFFEGDQIELIKAICDRVIPQDDRLPEFRIPVPHYIDWRLFEGRI